MGKGAEEATDLPPHVLIFPVPIQGHIMPMLKLAQLLCLSDIDITFIVSKFNLDCLLNRTTILSQLERYPGFSFLSIPDGLPDDHSRVGEQVMELFPSIRETMRPLLKQMMVEKNLFASETRRPISCIISDGILSFNADFAEEKGIPLIYFRTSSAASFWAYYCIPELIEAGEIPSKGIGDGMDLLVKSVPGVESFLRFRDLPSLCRVKDINDPMLHFVTSMTRQTTRAQALIFNSFEDLEMPMLSQIRKHIPKIFTIGPSHTHLKSRLIDKEAESSVLSGSLWEEDQTCMDWLNAQPPKSVLYVSFGSLTVVSRDQLLEFWHGLVNSEQRFLWVMRPDSIVGKDGTNQIPKELEAGTEARGYMVRWAPQEEVLNHAAIGGFLTHSGWNSTMESIAACVPMICWPYFADQMINSRFVSEFWKIGLDIKDTCDRVIIEKAIRELMETRKNEFLESIENLANLSRKATGKGGSSYNNLDDLIDYIKSTII